MAEPNNEIGMANIGGTLLLPISPLPGPDTETPEIITTEPLAITSDEADEQITTDTQVLGSIIDGRQEIRTELEQKQKELAEAQRKLAAGEFEKEPTEDLSALISEEKEQFFIQFKRPDGSIGIFGPQDSREGAQRLLDINLKDGNYIQAEVVGQAQADIVKNALGTIDQTSIDISQEQQDLQDQVDQFNTDLDEANTELENLRVSASDASDALIKSIQQTFAARKTQMEDINKRNLASIRTFGIRGGAARYASLIAGGIVAAEERAGIQKLANLDALETSLIAQAQSAQVDQDFELLHEKLDNIKELRKEKVTELSKLKEETRKRNQELEDRKTQLSRENAISSLINQGITDPSTIQLLLGGNVTQEEIGDVLDTIFEARGQVRKERTELAEEQRKAIADIVPLLSQQLTGDAEENAKIINQFAQERGLDPEILASSLIQFQQEQIKPALTTAEGQRLIIDMNSGDIIKVIGATGDDINLSDTKFASLTAANRLQAVNLVTKLTKGKGTTEFKNTLIKDVFEEMLLGKTIDDIEDSIRESSQSDAFTGLFRDAAELIAIPLGASKSSAFFDTFDRALETFEDTSDLTRIQDVLTRGVLTSLPSAQAKIFRGDQRAVELFDEIAEDLRAYEAGGGNTGFFSGNIEKIVERVGQTKDVKMAKLANKIAIGIQKYRQVVSGLAFTESEAKEYKSIFPSTDKISELNSAKMESARGVLQGNVDFILSGAMGQEPFDAIFLGKGLTGGGGDGAQPGEIKVTRISDGSEGFIQEDEFDPAIYRK